MKNLVVQIYHTAADCWDSKVRIRQKENATKFGRKTLL